jgi:oligoribonuclease
MSQLKNNQPALLLWVDLEMTGLDPEYDVILEESSFLTDFDFNVLSKSSYRIFHNQQNLEKLFKQNLWWQEHLDNQKQFLDNIDKGYKIEVVEDRMLDQINQYCDSTTDIFLAGNSIHSDRKFIAKYMQRLDSRLHYRMLDVSSFKILMNFKYNLEFNKDNNHRSLLDIKESIDELKYYLQFFKLNEQ